MYNPRTWVTGDIIQAIELNALEAGVAAALPAAAAAPVATSGAYADLTGKPTIPSVAGLAATSYVDAHTYFVRVKDYGAKGDGATNDTAAITAAITAAPNGAVLWFDAGTYLVDGITPKTRQTLTGPSSRVYLDTTTDGATIRARLATQTAPVVTLPSFARLADLTIVANNKTGPAVRATGGATLLERVSLTGGTTGFDANYQGGHTLVACQIHGNTDGIIQLVDSMVTNCVINANSGAGINLQAGSNDNMIVGNKIEWNDGYGVLGYQADNVTMAGNLIDRSGKAGVAIISCTHWSVASGVIRRNGRLSSGVTSDDCHIYQSSCTGVTVTGIATRHGKDDDGGGYDSPSASIVDDLGTDIVYVGNDLSGYVTTVARSLTPGTRRGYAGNAGYTAPQVIGASRPQIGSAVVIVATTATGTATFSVDPLATFDIGNTYKLLVNGRDVATGARNVAEIPLYTFRESGNAGVGVGTVANLNGTAFGAGTGTYQVTATAAIDASTLTVSIKNTSANTVQYTVRLV